MGLPLTALRGSLLTAAGIAGAIGAFHGVPTLFEEHGFDAGSILEAAGFVVTLLAMLFGGGAYLLLGRRRQFRLHAGGALLLFGLSLLTVQGVGYYFVTAGALGVLSLSVLATKRPSDKSNRPRWLRWSPAVRG